LRHTVGDAEFDWFRQRCKAWGCETCGPKKAVRLRKAIERRARELGLGRFLTLTLDPSKLDEGTDPIQYLRGHVWAKFRIYLKRKYGRSIQYIAVLEHTEAGVPHLHVLVDRFIPQAWISETWDALGGGRVVDIRRVYDMNRVARYLSKYLTKQVILSAPRGIRRWSVSRGIRLFEKVEKGKGWLFINASFDAIHRRAEQFVAVETHDATGLLTHFTTIGDARAI
jgi:hypothetical protein